ncbi:glycerophosphodiester phosphodiesterase family protein [Hymenobacter cavernae]|uniref:Glycerophosphoryl diester phosphodiesterase n=1 Tax=Hymenobacter cavernae TaxID=2044852 RepID=A0ABQ1UAK2_9BACT|nr:glycerophosphodiester phosphodiesterase family protein [Hymenobacter cavernae]GGF12730.1 glycerophosphoryl diester phosphodiesterase [Hymenobacter cavernae]
MQRPLFFLLILSTFSAAAQRSLDVQGHRGCRGLMPENTIPAMRKAQDLGVTTLEMDIAISQDKQPLLSHDPFLNADFVYRPDGSAIPKAEEKNYRIYGMPYREVRRYDVGSHGNPKFPRQQKLKTYKPLLAEVIDSAEAYARRKHLALPRYNIETKVSPEGDNQFHPAPEEFVQLLMPVLVTKKVLDRVTIQSFDPRTLEVVHRLYPAVQTALLVENIKGLEYNLKRLTFKPSIYSPAYKLVTPDLVQSCHQQGVKVIPWTVNSAAEINKLIEQQVDGVITDYPDLLSAK